MIRQETKMEPKGQIVIPKIFREHKKIYPDDKVFVELRENMIIIEKPTSDPISVFEEISRKNKSVKVNSDKDYDEMMKERWKKKSI